MSAPGRTRHEPRAVARLVLTNALAAVLLALTVVTFALQGAGGDALQAAAGVVLVGAPLVTGWILALRVPRNGIGWGLLFVVASLVGSPFLTLIGTAVLPAAPRLAAWLTFVGGNDETNWTWVPAIWTLLIWIPLHFPDGRLPSRRWRWFSRIAVGLLVYAALLFALTQGPVKGLPNPVAVPAVAELQLPLLLVGAAVAVACFVTTVGSLVVRYRRGDARTRAQLRWVLWAVALATIALSMSWMLSSDVVDAIGQAAFGTIPIAIGIAVLRYRLYEIDRIISRTAAYLLLTLTLVGIYGLVVLGVSLLSLALPDLPSIGVPLATLAAAAVFLPALRLLRRSLDRVFDRARYDAERVVAAFGDQIRNGADPHTAGEQLRAAVEASLDPAAVGLWLRP